MWKSETPVKFMQHLNTSDVNVYVLQCHKELTEKYQIIRILKIVCKSSAFYE